MAGNRSGISYRNAPPSQPTPSRAAKRPEVEINLQGAVVPVVVDSKCDRFLACLSSGSSVMRRTSLLAGHSRR